MGCGVQTLLPFCPLVRSCNQHGMSIQRLLAAWTSASICPVRRHTPCTLSSSSKALRRSSTPGPPHTCRMNWPHGELKSCMGDHGRSREIMMDHGRSWEIMEIMGDRAPAWAPSRWRRASHAAAASGCAAAHESIAARTARAGERARTPAARPRASTPRGTRKTIGSPAEGRMQSVGGREAHASCEAVEGAHDQREISSTSAAAIAGGHSP